MARVGTEAHSPRHGRSHSDSGHMCPLQAGSSPRLIDNGARNEVARRPEIEAVTGGHDHHVGDDCGVVRSVELGRW